jgi:hypothetical protein
LIVKNWKPIQPDLLQQGSDDGVHECQEGLATAVQPNPMHDTQHQYAKNNPRALTFPNKSSKFAFASQAMVLSTAIREKSNGNFTPQKDDC